MRYMKLSSKIYVYSKRCYHYYLQNIGMNYDQFLARFGGISRCHRELAEVARTKIDSLQSDLNYLIFDIEATRRERDEYKRRLGL